MTARAFSICLRCASTTPGKSRAARPMPSMKPLSPSGRKKSAWSSPSNHAGMDGTARNSEPEA